MSKSIFVQVKEMEREYSGTVSTWERMKSSKKKTEYRINVLEPAMKKLEELRTEARKLKGNKEDDNFRLHQPIKFKRWELSKWEYGEKVVDNKGEHIEDLKGNLVPWTYISEVDWY